MASTATTFDTDCVLMCHCDDSSITDSSNSAHAQTLNGTAAEDTVTFKFGTGSLKVPSTSSFMTSPNSSDWAWGTGDFTVDFWFFPVTFNSSTSYALLSINAASTFEILRDSGNKLDLIMPNGHNLTSTWTPTLSTWTHVAVTRSGTTLRAFIDGTQLGINITNSDNMSTSAILYIGRRSDGAFNVADVKYDEIRIVKGTAVWTANFTPPSAAYVPAAAGNLTFQLLPLLGVG